MSLSEGIGPSTIEEQWKLVEMFVIGAEEWKHHYSTEMSMRLPELLQNVYKEKEEFAKNQNLARIYFLACFVNAYDEDEQHQHREDIEQAERIQKRFSMLYNVAKYCCGKDVIQEVIYKSAVMEFVRTLSCMTWGHEQGRPKRIRVWDRFPLVFPPITLKKNHKKKNEKDFEKSSQIDPQPQPKTNRRKKFVDEKYQIRFLALEGDNMLDVCRITVKHHLEGEEKGSFRMSKEYSIVQVENPINPKHIVDGPPPKKSNAKETCKELPVMHVHSFENDRGKVLQLTYAPVAHDRLQPLSEVSFSSKQQETKTFCIPTKIGVAADRGGKKNVRICTTLTMTTTDGGEMRMDYGEQFAPLYSPTFEINANVIQDFPKKFLPCCWAILESHYGTKGVKSKNTSRRWSELEPWIAGIVAAQNENYCRDLSKSEIRAFRRMLLMDSAMKAIDSKNSWPTEGSKALQFEEEVFGKLVNNRDEKPATPDLTEKEHYKRMMFKNLKSLPISDDYRFTEKHFREKCWFVNRYFVVAGTRSEFSPIEWIWNAASIIADRGPNLHNDRERTTYFFNEGFINMRSADSAYTISKQSLERCLNNPSSEAAVVVRIDDMNRNHLCVDFPDVDKKEVLVGRPHIEMLRYRLFITDSSFKPQFRKRTLDSSDRPVPFLWGLEAYFKSGYPKLFHKIVKLDPNSVRIGSTVLIFKPDTEKDSQFDSAYTRNIKLLPRESFEVDEIAGPMKEASQIKNHPRSLIDCLTDVLSEFSMRTATRNVLGRVPSEKNTSLLHHPTTQTTLPQSSSLPSVFPNNLVSVPRPPEETIANVPCYAHQQYLPSPAVHNPYSHSVPYQHPPPNMYMSQYTQNSMQYAWSNTHQVDPNESIDNQMSLSNQSIDQQQYPYVENEDILP